MNNRLVSPNVDPSFPSNDADLSDLQAAPESRRRAKSTREDPHTSSDLAQASLSTSVAKDPLQQLSVTPEKRSSLKARVHRAPSTSRDLEARIKEGRAPPNNKATRKAAQTGIFSNPYYPYRGGPIARLITFLANLLKVIERLLLQGLGKGTVIEQRTAQRVTSPAAQSSSEQKHEEHTLSALEDSLSLSLTVASSSGDENDHEENPAPSYDSSAGSAS